MSKGWSVVSGQWSVVSDQWSVADYLGKISCNFGDLHDSVASKLKLFEDQEFLCDGEQPCFCKTNHLRVEWACQSIDAWRECGLGDLGI